MSIKSEYNEQIEAYLSGEMQGADRLVFEGRVESDPLLKSEFEHQQQIVESLKAQRVAELKTRLNDIAIETGVLGTLLQSSVFKPALYAVTGIAVTVGSYLYFSTESSTMEYHIQGLDFKNEYALSEGANANLNPELTFRHESKSVKVDLPELEPELQDEVVETEEVVVASKSEIKFEVPTMDAGLQHDEFEGGPVVALESPDRIEEVPTVSKIDRVNIQTINSRRYNFHYRMEDNRLYLYGKFNESPYEIIEINTPGAKKLYFFYDGDFYALNKDASDVTPLSKIENRKLINELDVIKSSNL
ncbi:hypothetical protein [Reichenbachiella ulvae]|uniref:DUF4367 domain-containing protein n=1 Tax=Reichenbachiella ulvae TaxID=2980104 RepID=A0ABT3CYP8_9BACT|nr:hypothetical protein [Reichenbachiella ulvae]MCV9388747.1 hypothetical protein [Reichenbachiella ulvae]